MNKVIIIGAGQLGSRHLQGALLSKNELHITVVDPSAESLNVAEKRAREVELANQYTSVIYCKDLPKNEAYDVCIIATSANIRASVTEKLLSHNEVRNIVFEKVLFQKLDDYEGIDKLLKSKLTKGWVNCPRRLFPTYQTLKEELDLSLPVHMTVNGNGWGMACNSVHFLDLFTYLINSSSMQLSEAELDKELIKSKREGFLEVTGQLSFSIGEHTLEICCGKGSNLNLDLSIKNGEMYHFVNEIEGIRTKVYNGSKEQFSHRALFQSELTGQTVDELISHNSCGLTPFVQSCEIHTPFINALIKHMSIVLGKELDECPIT
ncbi:Gfo/Idh/MocA family oxidoreductase [Vibrio sp. TRT 21S02]|uniref:Gfo/Idh/MocA family oxidoreductase n=1 Tax=Vibrio sp. TRT 21S02 TaxID=3418507 RepID=UPI003CEB5D59